MASIPVRRNLGGRTVAARGTAGSAEFDTRIV